MKDQYGVIFHIGDCPQEPHRIDFFGKMLKFTKSRIPNIYFCPAKLVWENAPGASRPQGGSKLHSESNGMHPGPQDYRKKSTNPQNTTKITKIRKSLKFMKITNIMKITKFMKSESAPLMK